MKQHSPLGHSALTTLWQAARRTGEIDGVARRERVLFVDAAEGLALEPRPATYNCLCMNGPSERRAWRFGIWGPAAKA